MPQDLAAMLGGMMGMPGGGGMPPGGAMSAPPVAGMPPMGPPGMAQGASDPLMALLMQIGGPQPLPPQPAPPAAMPGLASGMPPPEAAGPGQASLLELLMTLFNGNPAGMQAPDPLAMLGAPPATGAPGRATSPAPSGGMPPQGGMPY